MSGQKNSLITLGLVLSVSLIAAGTAVLFASHHYSRLAFELLNAVCGEVVEEEPETRRILSAALKEYTGGNPDGTAEGEVLSSLGYGVSDFSGFVSGQSLLFAAGGFAAGGLLFLFTFLARNKIEDGRIRALTEYLEQAHAGRAPVLSATGEDAFSRLEDEIYKTVTFLYQTRDAAVQAKNGFAENLSNIAHQIRTPMTAISLSVQMMKQEFRSRHLEQAERQLRRLEHLEEALLVLARLDAGTLPLQREEVDVFTLLVLAADHLQQLLSDRGSGVEIPELGGMRICVDPDWTMEAVINLMKNCMEHSRGTDIHCSYAQNPLYTEIRIWDDGEGFAKEDLPRLFERFYRGKNAGEGGIGIGLALAKEIVERQNGTIWAKNGPGGGALFEIRFYSH